MASARPSNVLTLSDLTDQTSVLRLRLTSAATDLSSRKAKSQGNFDVHSFIGNIFGQKSVELEERADKSTTERNKRKVNDLFEKIKNDLNNKLEEQKNKVLDTMDGLTEEQQQGVLIFWTEAYNFLLSAINWIRDVFDTIIQKLSEGWRIAKGAVNGFFASVMQMIKDMLK